MRLRRRRKTVLSLFPSCRASASRSAGKNGKGKEGGRGERPTVHVFTPSSSSSSVRGVSRSSPFFPSHNSNQARERWTSHCKPKQGNGNSRVKSLRCRAPLPFCSTAMRTMEGGRKEGRGALSNDGGSCFLRETGVRRMPFHGWREIRT